MNREVGRRVGLMFLGRRVSVRVSMQIPVIVLPVLVAVVGYYTGRDGGWLLPMLCGVFLGSVEIFLNRDES